jgi:hypothetical protein
MRRATAARQEWSSLRTWDRKVQRVTSGVKIRPEVVPTSSATIRATLATARTWWERRSRSRTMDRKRLRNGAGRPPGVGSGTGGPPCRSKVVRYPRLEARRASLYIPLG